MFLARCIAYRVPAMRHDLGHTVFGKHWGEKKLDRSRRKHKHLKLEPVLEVMVELKAITPISTIVGLICNNIYLSILPHNIEFLRLLYDISFNTLIHIEYFFIHIRFGS